MISVVVVDDEKGVRTKLVSKLHSSGLWNVVGEADSPSKALAIIQSANPEAIFLDIKLREGDAFDVLDGLTSCNLRVPYIILNTGFRDFELASRALNNYSKHIIKLLEKPFWENWAEKEKDIVTRIKELITDSPYSFVYIHRSDNLRHRVFVKDILLLQASNGGTEIIYTKGQRDFILKPMKEVLVNFEGTKMIKIHRSIVVNRDWIVAMAVDKVKLVDGSIHSVARSKRSIIKKMILQRSIQ